MAASSEGLAARTLRGLTWAYGSYVGGRLLVMGSTAVLARVLDPDDFGVVSAALTFMVLLDAVSDLGLSQAIIIVDEDKVREQASTAFWGTIGLGALLFAILTALSPLIADFYHEHALVWVTPLLASNFLIRAIGNTHYELARKWLDFRSRTIGEFADVVVRGLTGITLALAGAGPGALVAGYLAGTAALVVVMWWRVPWRPRLHVVPAYLRPLLSFGARLSAVDLIGAVIGNVDYLFIGHVLGTSLLGVYVLGFQLPDLIITNVSVVAGSVLFPAFAALRGDRVGEAFLLSLRYVLLIGLPLAAGLCILARPFILAVFGDKWTGAVVPMQILTIYALCGTIGVPAGTAYKSLGRAGIIVRLGATRLVLAAGSIAFFVHDGIRAVAACQAAAAGVIAAVGIVLASRLLGVGLRAVGRAAIAPLAATAALGVALLLVERSIDDPWPALVVGAPAGALAYVACLRVVGWDAVLFLWETARSRGRRDGDGAVEATAMGEVL